MNVAARAEHLEPALTHCRQMRAARKEGHVAAALGQRRSERPTDPARADHRNPHWPIPLLPLRPALLHDRTDQVSLDRRARCFSAMAIARLHG